MEKTKFKLAQKKYTDCNGEPIDASTVDGITVYNHIADGFYEWYCFYCNKIHSNRSCGWPIAGQILYCSDCMKWNLLLRSDIELVNKGIKFALEYEKEKSVIDAFKKRAEDAEKYEREFRSNIVCLVQRCQSKMSNWLGDEFSKMEKDVINAN